MKVLGLDKQSDRVAGLCEAGWLVFQLPWPERLGIALGPERVVQGRMEGGTQKNRGNNDPIFIACNSVYTITHSIRSPTEK